MGEKLDTTGRQTSSLFQDETIAKRLARLLEVIQASDSESLIENALVRAQIYEENGLWDAAIEAYQEALSFFDPKGSSAGEILYYTNLRFRLALCLKQAGRWSEALKLQEENVAGYKKLGNLYGKASAYLEMGHIYQMMNIYDLALLYCGEAYYLYQQAAEEATAEAARRLAQQGMANAKEALGNLEFQLKVLPKALTDLEEAQKLYTALGIPGKVAIIRQTLRSAETPQEVLDG